jgi:hypothetical protein
MHNGETQTGKDSPEEYPDRVGISFIDLLYAVPVADLATRVSATHLHISATGWTDVLLPLTALTLGWIGHHTNRLQMPVTILAKRRAANRPFTELRFPQFLLEVLIVGAYFALGVRAVLPAGQGVGSPALLWKAEWLTGIFVLYWLWDSLDIRIAKDLTSWREKAKRGRTVTLLFIVVFAVFLVVVLQGSHHVGSAVLFDVLAMIFLYLYRVAQQCWTARSR